MVFMVDLITNREYFNINRCTSVIVICYSDPKIKVNNIQLEPKKYRNNNILLNIVFLKQPLINNELKIE